VLGPNFVISFQESIGDVFEPIRDRIRKAKGRIRKAGPDYLAYALLDAIVDGYFSVLEATGERIESLEEQLVKEPAERIPRQIHALKREMIFLRKSIWPLRELVSNLQRSESDLIAESTRIYLRDVYDHTIQVIDTVESYRDIVHSPYLCCGNIRHEFQTYAGVGVAMGLCCGPAGYARDGRGHDSLFQKEEVALRHTATNVRHKTKDIRR
jgi:Mg2+ and Co2+ transporter CorA